MSAPIKMWTDGVSVEESAKKQIENIASLSIVYPHIAIMPDVHWGCGATVGSVIPTINAIIPAAVGVDIGCGMMAVRTSLKAADSVSQKCYGYRRLPALASLFLAGSDWVALLVCV